MSFKIGDIQIDNSVVVAPMAGISNSAFRVTVKEFGAGLVVCEMISDKGIQFRNEKTLSMLHIEPNEYPLSVQIMGGNKDTWWQLLLTGTWVTFLLLLFTGVIRY